MGLGQYDGHGEYCSPHTASSVFLIVMFPHCAGVAMQGPTLMGTVMFESG